MSRLRFPAVADIDYNLHPAGLAAAGLLPGSTCICTLCFIKLQSSMKTTTTETFIFWQRAKVAFTEQLQELWEYNTTKPFCVCYFKGKKLLMIRKSFYLSSTHLAAALLTVLGVLVITNANAISLLYTIRVVLCSLPWQLL